MSDLAVLELHQHQLERLPAWSSVGGGHTPFARGVGLLGCVPALTQLGPCCDDVTQVLQVSCWLLLPGVLEVVDQLKAILLSPRCH